MFCSISQLTTRPSEAVLRLRAEHVDLRGLHGAADIADRASATRCNRRGAGDRHGRPLEEAGVPGCSADSPAAPRGVAAPQLLEQIGGLRQRALVIDDVADRKHARGARGRPARRDRAPPRSAATASAYAPRCCRRHHARHRAEGVFRLDPCLDMEALAGIGWRACVGA